MDSTIGRRDFVKLAGGATLALGCEQAPTLALGFAQAPTAPGPDAAERDLVLLALDAAKSAGASYADARVTHGLFEAVGTREQQITNVTKTETYGIGVRALVGGSWGFAATRDLSKDAIARTAREAATIAASNDKVAPVRMRLAPVTRVTDGRWITPHEIDPFGIPIEQKANLLLKTNAEALRVKGVRFVSSSILSVKERRLVATSDGSILQQTFIRLNPDVTITAVAADSSDFQTRGAVAAPAGRGWEYIVGLNLPANVVQWAEEAAMKLTATPVEPGTWDLVLHPSHLWLTIHESIAHPTELDRALGYEANYAGTTFLAAPEKVLRTFKLGPELMTVQANRTEPGGCATVGWDDEGVAATSYPIIDKGVFVNYQSATRDMVAWTSSITGVKVSPGHAYGEDWSAIPFPRMSNVSLLAGRQDLSEEDVIGATKRGIYIEGDGSYSIDQQRYNFQFGGQVFWEIRDGKKTRMLRDAAYVARTPEFWRSLAVIGGPRTYGLGATFTDAKGQPGQANAVSHGCPIALFRNVTVINTA
jgi:TldD protein